MYKLPSGELANRPVAGFVDVQYFVAPSKDKGFTNWIGWI